MTMVKGGISSDLGGPNIKSHLILVGLNQKRFFLTPTTSWHWDRTSISSHGQPGIKRYPVIGFQQHTSGTELQTSRLPYPQIHVEESQNRSTKNPIWEKGERETRHQSLFTPASTGIQILQSGTPNLQPTELSQIRVVSGRTATKRTRSTRMDA